jgi:hypothetical protein
VELTRVLLGRRLLALLAVAVLASGCTQSRTGEGQGRGTSPATQVVVGENKPCADAGRYGALCRFVRVDGRPYRYALVPGGAASAGLTLLDPGGPGSSLFGRGWPADSLARLRSTDVLVLEEPWVIAGYPAECRTSMTSWYRALSAGGDGSAAAGHVAHDCDLFTGRWGWDAETYGKVLSAVLAQEHRTPDAFVGFSFGSARLAYAEAAGVRFSRVDLYSPFPVGASAADWLHARERDLARGPVFSDAVVGTAPEGRSIAVSASDVGAAEVQAQYFDRRTRRSLSAQAQDARLVGRLSDMLFGRYGVDDLSPALLAYWDETCTALRGWTAAGTGSFLARFDSVCSAAADSATLAAPSGGVEATCVAGSREDGIVPVALLRQWAATRRWHLAVAGGRHADPALMRRCAVGSRADADPGASDLAPPG